MVPWLWVKIFYFFTRNKYKNNLILPYYWKFLLSQTSNFNFVLKIPALNRDIEIEIYSTWICAILELYRYHSGIAQQSENPHFAQDNSRIVPIPILRRTNIRRLKVPQFRFSIQNSVWLGALKWRNSASAQGTTVAWKSRSSASIQ